MSWQNRIKGDSLAWLLEPGEPAVRLQALQALQNRAPDDPLCQEARFAAHQQGPIPAILENMAPEGYWEETGPGYLPKYRSTVWSVVLLAQLGASLHLDERIQRACAYLLDHSLSPDGQFSASSTPSGTADCLQGNLCWALITLGCEDERLNTAYEWMARTVTGEGIAPSSQRDAPLRYYAGKCGPNFACGSNNKQSCAWGAAKVMLAFSVCPPDMRTPLVERAVQAGIDFLFSVDPATAAYPSGYGSKPSGNWWKFGFPVFYVIDLLQIAEALAALGCAKDPRLDNTVQVILSKQDPQGRWLLEYDYRGKTWLDFGEKKQPNKWVTLRALRVIKAAYE
jgi:hypothetical protein